MLIGSHWLFDLHILQSINSWRVLMDWDQFSLLVWKRFTSNMYMCSKLMFRSTVDCFVSLWLHKVSHEYSERGPRCEASARTGPCVKWRSPLKLNGVSEPNVFVSVVCSWAQWGPQTRSAAAEQKTWVTGADRMFPTNLSSSNNQLPAFPLVSWWNNLTLRSFHYV